MRTPLVIQGAQTLSAYDYWSNFQSNVPNWGPIALMLCAQRSGQGASERMHQVVKRVRQKESNRISAPVTAAMSELRMHLAREKFCTEEEAREAKGTDRVHVLGLVAESLADRSMEAKKVQVATQAANALVNMQQSEDFDAYDEDQDSQEVDNEIHAAAEGNGEYGGIHDGNQDAVIQALLDLSES